MNQISIKMTIAVATSFMILAGVAQFLSRHARSVQISRTTFEQIEVGMNREQVESIIGGPPGFYGEPMIDSSPWTQVGKYGSTHAGLADYELEREDEAMPLSAFGLLFKSCSITAVRVAFDEEGRTSMTMK